AAAAGEVASPRAGRSDESTTTKANHFLTGPAPSPEKQAADPILRKTERAHNLTNCRNGKRLIALAIMDLQERRDTAGGAGMTERPDVPRMPLFGLRVLDLGRHQAGPTCAMWLGDLGADVLKIENPERGEDGRASGPPFFDGISAFFLSANRN